jgi:hypothetical protein
MLKEYGMKSIYTAVAVIAIFATGCATLITPKEQKINVASSTGDAIDVTLDGKTSSTPGQFTVLRNGQDKIVNTSTPGCAPSTPVNKTIAPAFWGNVIIGGLLGSTTDNATGKMYTYADNVVVQCAPK